MMPYAGGGHTRERNANRLWDFSGLSGPMHAFRIPFVPLNGPTPVAIRASKPYVRSTRKRVGV